MPPFVPRKRRATSPPEDQRQRQSKIPKQSVDAIDESSGSPLSDVGSSDSEDEDVDWEDAVPTSMITPVDVTAPSGDLEITLGKHDEYDASTTLGKKKGPTKIERQIRIRAHCMHVQLLMFHNLVRNVWISDKQVQKILIDQLPANIKKEIDKLKLASGTARQTVSKKTKRKSGRGRDWSDQAEREEPGVPDVSHGDPTLRMLKVLVTYWKTHFSITAPGLRKRGWRPLSEIEKTMAAYEHDSDMDQFGETVENIDNFKMLARECRGSRDVGAQLFVALLRGLGYGARLVASLQPIGFGWNKAEEADNTDIKEEKEKEEEKPSESQQKRSRKNGKRASTYVESDTSSSFSEISSEEETASGKAAAKTSYDRDLPFPIYWAEVSSPVTHEIIPVDPISRTTTTAAAVATKPEHIAFFEPRGVKAERAKQVIGYVIAFSSDGTAKDVTTRYLKRHMWPGKTKGIRIPVEKVPVYNKHGKIRRYEEYDWFKTVMSVYARPDWLRTTVDDVEDATDLKPVRPEPRARKSAQPETLQGYKSSAEFVLERFLRREEALKPGAKVVKTFTAGKGARATEENVYLRSDIEVCKTAESWHKEGREIKEGEMPLKLVPVRAVTLTRKREVEEAERETGEKLKQGLYSERQTRWIVPPPIENGVIPKNGYGNMDCFVPSMIPKGAVHVRLNGTVRICKRLGIDYAEACVGFEFGNKRAVPIIHGVVVAEENEDVLVDAWGVEEEQRKRRECEKRSKAALKMWKKLLIGLRVTERFRQEYGDVLAGGSDAVEESASNDIEYEEEEEGFLRDETDEGVGGFISNETDQELAGGFLSEETDQGVGGFISEETNQGVAGGFLSEETDQELVDDALAEPALEDMPDSMQSEADAPKTRTPKQSERRSKYWSNEKNSPKPVLRRSARLKKK